MATQVLKTPDLAFLSLASKRVTDEEKRLLARAISAVPLDLTAFPPIELFVWLLGLSIVVVIVVIIVVVREREREREKEREKERERKKERDKRDEREGEGGR